MTVTEAVACCWGDRRVVALEGALERPLSDLEFAAMVGCLERRERIALADLPLLRDPAPALDF